MAQRQITQVAISARMRKATAIAQDLRTRGRAKVAIEEVQVDVETAKANPSQAKLGQLAKSIEWLHDMNIDYVQPILARFGAGQPLPVRKPYYAEMSTRHQ